jgi:hypothetical protein
MSARHQHSFQGRTNLERRAKVSLHCVVQGAELGRGGIVLAECASSSPYAWSQAHLADFAEHGSLDARVAEVAVLPAYEAHAARSASACLRCASCVRRTLRCFMGSVNGNARSLPVAAISSISRPPCTPRADVMSSMRATLSYASPTESSSVLPSSS